MVEPVEQDLYIMQNEFGLIKIGRSVDAERRRITLQTSERCRIKIVEVYASCGDMEESIHYDMDGYRLAGEWFDGSDEARAALCELIECPNPPMKWPYAYNGVAAGNWLEHINVVRHANAIRRELYREIMLLRSADGPSWIYDSGIFYASWRAATGNRPGLDTVKIDGETATQWFDPDSEAEGVVPRYTRNVETALLAWPAKLRPVSWEGSAIECCIAALIAIRDGLPKVPRQ